MKYTKVTCVNLAAFLLATTCLTFSSTVRAASSTWLNTNTTGITATTSLWNNPANWAGNVVPGATTTITGGTYTNTDIATFNTPVTSVGTSTHPVGIDSGRNIDGMIFDTGAGSYIVGVTNGSSLLLTSGGTIQITSGVTTASENINAPLVLEGDNGTYTFRNDSTGTTVFNFGGAISAGGSTGTTNLNLSGNAVGGNSHNVISGVLKDGASAQLSLTKNDNGLWILTGANTYTGATTVNAGTLQVGAGTTGSLGNTATTIGASGTLAFNMADGGSYAGPIANSGAIVMAQTGTTTLSNSIGGTGVLTQSGTGITVLSGTNTYSGNTTVTTGTIRAADGTGLSPNSLLILNGTDTASPAIFESLGGASITRSSGTGPGQVQLIGTVAGLSANGGTTTVNLGNAGGTVSWGSAAFNPKLFVLNAATATNQLNFENALDFGGTGHSIGVVSTTAPVQMDGALINGGLAKQNNGTLILASTGNTYGNGTLVGAGLLAVNSNSSIGTGGATVTGGGELRFSSTSNIASGQLVKLYDQGALGITSSAFGPAVLASIIDPSSSGILAIDTAYASSLNMGPVASGGLSNNGTYLGSSIGTNPGNGGVYSAATLTPARGGTEPTIFNNNFATAHFGSTYLLGGGGGVLTLTAKNVLTDQASLPFLTNLTNSLAASNTRNSVKVGPDGGNGGTLALANNQSYTGLTTVNNGSTLLLDFSGASGTTPGSNDIINAGNEVDLKGGGLAVTGGGSDFSQTLSNVGLYSGVDTITTTKGSGALTVNLGVLGSGVAGSGLVANPGTSLQVVQGSATAANLTTSTATGPDTVGGTGTFGGQMVYTNNAGITTWAAGTTTGTGLYTIGTYSGEVAAPAALNGVSGSTDYLVSSSQTLTTPQQVNLLHMTGGTLTGGTTTSLTVNSGGILFTGSSAISLGQSSSGQSWLTSGTPANSGGYNFLNLMNYGTGGVSIGSNKGVFMDNGATHTTVVYSGTGTYSIGIQGQTNTGGDIINPGVTMRFGDTTDLGTGLVTINGGTLTEGAANGSGAVQTAVPFAFNGNFTLGRLPLDNGSVTQVVSLGSTTNVNTLTNNVVITVDAGQVAFGTWGLGSIKDNGMGYGLTVNYVSGRAFNLGSTGAFPSGVVNSFTGSLNLQGAGANIGVGPGGTNRYMLVNVGPGINISAGSISLAGLNDLGPASSNTTINGGGVLTIFGSGNSSFGGSIQSTNAITMDGTGTQALTGANTFTGTITGNAGTLLVDASKGGSLIGTNALALNGGGFEVKGASTGTTQNMGNVSFGVGGSTFLVDNNGGAAGATKVGINSMIAGAAGSVLDIAEVGSAAPTITTTQFNINGTSGVIGAGNVVFTSNTGATTWATANTSGGIGASPFTIGAFANDSTALPSTGINTTTTSYNVTGSQTQTGNASIALLRVSNTATGTLDLAGNSLVLNQDGLLFNGTAAYTIGDSAGTGLLTGSGSSGFRQLIIQNYGTAPLTIGAAIANNSTNAVALTIAGPGTTIMTDTSTYTGATFLNGGTVNFNQLSNFGNTSSITFSGATLQYAAGNTTDLSAKPLTFNASGGTIDTNGNSVTYNSNFGTGIGGMTVVDSGATHGVMNINATTGYTGNTIVGSGGHINLTPSGNISAGGGNNIANGATIINSGGTLSGGTTEVTSAPQSTTSANVGRLILNSGGVLAPGDSTPGALAIQGVGLSGFKNGNQADGSSLSGGTAANNVMNATNLTWNAGGTLKFQLDNTIVPFAGAGTGTGDGTALQPSASTTLNLGTGSLVKVGTGTFTLDFSNTGTWDMVNGTSNTYDLINFGVTSNYGVLSPNTNFNIDDFTIQNLNGIGTLSYFYNASADGGVGQEELLLTVIPEPSTWAMLIGGFAMLIFWSRRRATKRSASFAKTK